VYLPFLNLVRDLYPGSSVLDLGCGRGEWLELTGELGFDAKGVDLDDGMLEVCSRLGLRARKQDAIDCLRELADESQSVVSAFHVVEHITFEQLQDLIKEVCRVLKPGGLLIMETPNPESVTVSTWAFYQDPTHQRPIPPQLLKFVTEYFGFSRSKIVRLQEPVGIGEKTTVTLRDVFEGVSPDYAVVAQKMAAVETMKKFDEAFSREYGFSQGDLLDRFDQSLDRRLDDLHSHLTSVKVLVDKTQESLGQIQDQVQTTEVRLQEKIQAIQEQIQRSYELLKEAKKNTGWRSLVPFRWFFLKCASLRQRGFVERVKAALRKRH